MTAKHAGESRIADTALIDQVRAAARDIRSLLVTQFDPRDFPHMDDVIEYLHQRNAKRNELLGRALALLEQIGEMGE